MVEYVIIDGRKATVAYLTFDDNEGFLPAHPNVATIVKTIFEDGDLLIESLTNGVQPR